MNVVKITTSNQYSDDPHTSYEEEAVVHDQLPNVEEIKTRSDFDKTDGSRLQQRKNSVPWKKTLLILGGIVFLCVVSFGGYIIARTRRYENAIISVTTTVRVSQYKSFDEPKSPQSQALKWMIYDDPLQLNLPLHRDDPFVQRYIAAVFVFAMAPSSQTRTNFHLLSSRHECKWNSKWKRVHDRHTHIAEDDEKDIELGFLCGKQFNYYGTNDIDIDNNNHNYYINKDYSFVNEDGIETSITAIILPKSDIVGELPPEMEVLNHLAQLDLDGNDVYGEIPPMPYLTHLSLAQNAFIGSMPSHFSEMTRLQFLSLTENSYQGPIPKAFGALTNLKFLALNGNELTGGIEQVYPLLQLEELNLSYNSFDYRLSNGSFKDHLNLKVIDLKSNRISGKVPDSLGQLTNLEVIDFHGNALDGNINDVFVPNHSLKYLDVSSNILGGGLPHSMSNLGALTHVDVSYNRFSSKLSNPLSNLTQLKTLLLTEGEDFGPQPLPGWLRRMTNLQQLSFRLTSRTGTIPTWFGELTNLELLDLDWNRLSGSVPSQLSQLTKLQYLKLNRNLLVGQVPYKVSSLPKLKMFMVDNNGFTGELKLRLDGKCPDLIKDVIADCGNPEDGCPDCDSVSQKIACPCCTDCCYENQQRCNMVDHLTEVEDQYRNSYSRDDYVLGDTSAYQYYRIA